MTLDAFSLTFIAEDGEIFILTPFLLEKIILKEKHFSQLLLHLSDLMQNSKEASKAETLRLALIAGKKKLNKADLCQVTFTKEIVEAVEIVRVCERKGSNYSDVAVLNNYPLSILAVQRDRAHMYLTFDHSPFASPDFELVRVSEISLGSQGTLWKIQRIKDELVYLLGHSKE